ncbi:MAG TPA: divergent polysaccharide deacetylase family protein [Alphaproteobacteria bacterium]|nr:divergent polysaccharide deacetylase family protein [Alphaproteobacteria bacterium]
MSISGPPRSSFALFGGPGFILLLLLVFGLGGGGLLLVNSGWLTQSGGASMSLPGSLGGAPAAPKADSAGDAAPLQPLQPMRAEPVAVAPPAEPAYPIVTEDLSPIDLLVRYTPDPALALREDEGGAAADDTRTDARRFRRPSTIPASANRLALVVTGLGRDRRQTAQAILALPAEISLSFQAGSADLESWIAAARAYGHEALIDLDLGTADTLAGAPGDLGDTRLLAELGPAENLRRLDALLARAPKAAGVAVTITDGFLADAAALTPILARLQAGGFVIVGLPVTAPRTIAADRTLDPALDAAGLAREAMALKALTRQRKAAVALSDAGNAIALAATLARSGGGAAEIALVPASALVED